MNKFRFHLLTLSHLPQHKQYSACAFTQKNRKLAKMLTSLGHEVFFYGSEGSDIEEYCNNDRLHFIETHKISEICESFGDGDENFELGYNWKEDVFRNDYDLDGDAVSPVTKKFYARCIEEIKKIQKPDDFLLVTQGNYHEPVADALGLYLTCESGIGYKGSNSKWFRCFESSFLQNYTYGSETPHKARAGVFYDRVIPNYFDPNDVEFSDDKDDYFLFVGRLIRLKGILEAYLTTMLLKKKLIIAGQGGVLTPEYLTNNQKDFEIPNDGSWEYVGFIDVEKRKKLMAHAKAFFCPTEYLEPFAGTHVEALLSGTPIITTNWGVFGGDTFLEGKDGFRCDILDDFIFAARACERLDHFSIRNRAERFLMDNVKWEFEKWFEDLYYVYLATNGTGSGWETLRRELPEWRKNKYPQLFI